MTTSYLNDPSDAYDRALEEYTTGGVRAATYVRGLDLLFEDRTGADGGTSGRSFYAVDGLGSTRALVNASGAVTDTTTYDAYGTTIAQTTTNASGMGTSNSYWYAGQGLDAATGLYYNHARYYEAAAGRFTSFDTFDGEISDPATLNKYSYGASNPINHIDPSGHDFLGSLLVSVGIGTTLGGIVGAATAPLTGQSLLSGAIRGAFLGAAGGALGAISFAAFAAAAGPYLSTVGTYWAATFLSGATTGSILSAGRSLYDTGGDAEQALRDGLVGAIGGSIFAGLGGIVFRAAAPIWLQAQGRIKGFSQQQFSEFSQAVPQGAGQYSDDVVVQGSRAGGIAKPTSDVDVAVRVNQAEFDALIKQRFTNVNPGSSKERTMLQAIQTGKIQAGEAGLCPLRKVLEQLLGIEVDISVILKGGPFDKGPKIPLN